VATLLTAAIALTAPTAHAAQYAVFTSSISASSINAADNYCSLAEAVKSINQGSPVANCIDEDTTNPGRIDLTQTAAKPYASFHYVLGGTTLTLSRSILITTAEEGDTAYIDASGLLAIMVNSGVTANFYGLDIRHTGTANGRLVWNAGTLDMSSTTIRNGNVTGQPLGKGGGIYNQGLLSLYSCQLLNNSAKRGGGIYNDDGHVPYLDATISGNSATMAGGGIYNMSTGNDQNMNAKAFMGLSGTITGNSAKAGGGVFNTGEMEVMGATSITSNVASGTGSGETCQPGPCAPGQTCQSVPCDGFGGGVLNLDFADVISAFRTNDFVTVSLNTATGFGGAFYSEGQLNLTGIQIASNTAKSGAAIFAAALVLPGDTKSNYCTVTSDLGQSSINSNRTVPSGGYSIVDSSGAGATHCTFAVSASGNTTPKCNPAGLIPGNSCPQ